MKKLLLILLVAFGIFTLSACNPEEVEDPTEYTVTFNSDGGSAVDSVTVEEGTIVAQPSNPIKEGFVFRFWYLSDASASFDFTTPINEDTTLTALWEEAIPEITDADLIQDDIDAYMLNMLQSEYALNLPKRGEVYSSRISWDVDDPFLSEDGIILPLRDGDTATTATYTGTFKLNETEVEQEFTVTLSAVQPVEIATSRTLPFESLTTEYDIADGELNIFYEENGSVPYVKVVDFFALLDGFIDPEVDFTFTTDDHSLEIFYQYYDEDYDELYDLIVTIDTVENTVVTNDPGFYWAYVYSTETNYGRHIDYVTDHPEASQEEGNDIVYDLDDFNMDIVMYEDDVVMPYYMVNQLFAGLSYFNVYYNYDGLYGIYSLPDDGSTELRTIQSSSLSGDDIPADLLLHTYDMLAFVMDNLYGLKDIMDVDTYYDLLYTFKDDLLVEDPEDFEDGLRDLLLQEIDEPHTSYGYSSYFNKATYDGPVTNDLRYYGSRFTQWYYDGLVDTDDAIAAKWNIEDGPGWSVTSDKRPLYWFLDDTTAMLSLDDFNTADIDETATFDAALVAEILEVDDISGFLPAIAEGTKFFNFNSTTEQDVMYETLVKGVSAGYVATYEAELLALGWTYNFEDNFDEDKQIGYYTISVPQTEGDPVDYMLQVVYDDTFDLFYVGIIDHVPLSFDGNWPMHANIKDTIISDSAIYMEEMLEEIFEEQPGTTDIILDLSWNTGGNIGALYRVVGFLTDDAFGVSGIDGDTGGSSTYFVDITGIEAYDQINWALLTTPTTFSAANEMATIFMSNDLGPIIGVTSGGGACSITPILLPNGTAFTMSSNNISAYRTGAGTEADPYVYFNTEFGITPDYEIDIEDIFNETVLLNILLND